MRLGAARLVFVLCLSTTCCLQAQTSQPAENVKLSADSKLTVNSFNAAQQQSNIIPELYDLIKAGVLEFTVSENAAWRQNHKSELALRSEKMGQLLDRQNAEGGAAIIELVNSFWSARNIISADFSIFRVQQNHADLSISGNFARIYKEAFPDSNSFPQLFRERLRLVQPKFLNLYSWLTFRFVGQDEDMVWIYSPAIQNVREVSGSNRTDSLLKSSFSLDDFLVWSGKSETIEAKPASRLNAYVPFVADMPAKAALAGVNCQQINSRADTEASELNWNYASAKFPRAAAWVPTNANFILRELVRVELVSRDPFALYGRQIIYIDRELGVPVYKIVFDRAGRHWKTLMAALEVTQSADASGMLVFPVFSIALDLSREQAFVLNFTRWSECKSLPDWLKLADFDPSKLGPIGEKQKESKKLVEATPNPILIDED